MRFLTPTEVRLLSDLPIDEALLVRGFFEELDARLVSEGDQHRGERIPGHAQGPAVSPSETSQSVLFPVRKERP